jgi:cysteine desulfurase/selenocysteine lyase
MNTNNPELPNSSASPISVEQLEKLANELFLALPSGSEGIGNIASYPQIANFDAQHPEKQASALYANAPAGNDSGLSAQIAAFSAQHPKATQCAVNLLDMASTVQQNPEKQASGLIASLPVAIPSLDAGNIYPQLADVATQHPAVSQYVGNLSGLANITSFGSPVDVSILQDGSLRKLLDQHSAVGSSAPDASSGFYFLNGTQPFIGEAQPLKFSTEHPAFDVNAVRLDFPILQERVNGRPLIWLDNAATTQKPQAVIDRLAYFYQHENSNIHRAAHELAARATDAYEEARDIVARFIHAGSSDEIIFVRGATEGINLVAKSWGAQNINAGDEIVITWLEHHANIVPWQQLCQQTGAVLKVAPVDDSGQILLSEYEKLLGSKTRLVSITQVSNALGTVTPIHEMIAAAHRHGARVLVDGAQGVSHIPVDVQSLDCDWYIFSGHKVFGPTGIGVVYGKLDLLNSTQPWQGGGNMIQDVTFEKTLYHQAPSRFEAGTGNIADAVGLGAALDYVSRLGIENINRYEHELLLYATKELQSISGLRLIGTAAEKTSVLSFVLDGYKSEEVGTALNKEGIAVRSGHHCAQPILRRFGVETTVRPSLAFYNTYQEIDVLVATIKQLQAGKYSI